MSDVGREFDKKQWILHQKIYIVGVLVDEIEREYPWSIESRESLIWFKKKTGKTPEFLEMWLELLADLLRQQRITLQELMVAEMENERSRHERGVKVAEIMRKPDTAMTAEDTEVITARGIAKEAPSGSSSRPDFKKGSRVEDDVRKGMPGAAPAVVRKISKAPPEQPPRRATPPIDPPAKWAKGASKGAAERATSGSRTGKGKGKKMGKKGSSMMDLPRGIVPLNIRDLDTCPLLLPTTGLREMGRLMEQDKSLFGETSIGTSEKLIGRDANA